MTQAIKLHTHLAPRRNIRRLTEEEVVALLVRARDESLRKLSRRYGHDQAIRQGRHHHAQRD
jgi:hypothetical protein